MPIILVLGRLRQENCNGFGFGLLSKAQVSRNYRVKTSGPKIKTPAIYKEINMLIHVIPQLVAISTDCP